MREEVAHDCQGCAHDKMMADFKDQQKDLLRGLIDQSLMVQRAKDMGISVESDVIKLPGRRAQTERPREPGGSRRRPWRALVWPGKITRRQFATGCLTQEVVRREVASHINIPNDEVKQYYDAHPQEFTRPEQVVLSEIFLSTEGKSPEEIEAVQKKAEDLRNRVMKGDDFNEIAKRYSEGSTAKDGGDLGTFKQSELDQKLEEVVFKLDKGQITDVIQAKTGFEILKVENHYKAGLQPQDKVENEIMNRLYMQKMQRRCAIIWGNCAKKAT